MSAGRSSPPPVVVYLAHDERLLISVSLTNQRAYKDAHIVGECKEAKGASLCVFGAVLREHGTDSDNSTSKDAREASEQRQLPYRLT